MTRRADRAAAARAEPQPARAAASRTIYGTATLDDHVAAVTEGAPTRTASTVEHLPVEPRGRAGRADPRRARPVRGDRHQPGAFTHYSLGDPRRARRLRRPVVEVHLSNPNAREPWRHTSVVAPVATGSIVGFGGHGYGLAVDAVAGAARLMTRRRSLRRPAGRCDVAGRADRAAGRAGDGAGLRRAARHRPRQRPLPHRASPGRPRCSSSLPDAAAASSPTAATGSRPPSSSAPPASRREVRDRPHRPAAATLRRWPRLPALGRLGLEAEHVTWPHSGARWRRSWFRDAELVPTDGLVEGLRLVKDDGEVARIEAAAAIADAALAEVLPPLGSEPTESDVRPRARHRDPPPRRRGHQLRDDRRRRAERRRARTTGAGSGRRIVEGDLVVIDFGALVDGYCSDMTRTVMVGDGVARRSADARRASPRRRPPASPPCGPASTARDVDEACRAVIRDAGWGDAFTHGTGHGVGLEIHEAPAGRRWAVRRYARRRATS